MNSPVPWSVDALGYIRAEDNTNVLEVRENAEFACEAVKQQHCALTGHSLSESKRCKRCRLISRAEKGS